MHIYVQSWKRPGFAEWQKIKVVALSKLRTAKEVNGRKQKENKQERRCLMCKKAVILSPGVSYKEQCLVFFFFKNTDENHDD